MTAHFFLFSAAVLTINILLCIVIVHSKDIFLFDEFQFSFDLSDEHDWDQYYIQHNTYLESNRDTFDVHGRRLTDDFNKKNEVRYNEYASKCTHRIPIIFTHLCVYWSTRNGFTFNYLSNPQHSNHHKNSDTNWFYASHDDKISSAKNAAKYYNILDGETWSISNDKTWDEIDFISSLDSRLNDDETYEEIPQNEILKQCRHKNGIQECARYDIDGEILTFNIKIPKGIYKKLSDSEHISPANMLFANMLNQKRRLYEAYDEIQASYNDVMIDNGYDDITQFAYGDMMGYILWINTQMGINDMKCVNCDVGDSFAAHLEGDDDSAYDKYGEYLYYFDEHTFDALNNDDWEIDSDDLSKCSIAIPGLHHKLCINHADNEHQVHFSAATEAEIDDIYYQMYGYDEYYYNEYYEYDGKRDENTDHKYRRRVLTDNLLTNLQYELRDLWLSFERDTDWDEISDINDVNTKESAHATRKCKALQTTQICATMHHKRDEDNLHINVKVGRHKYHRLPFYKSAAYHEIENKLRHINKEYQATAAQQLQYDLNTKHASDDVLQAMHWIIDNDQFRIHSKQWNDPLLFTSTHHKTYNKRHIVRKCKGALCICQYIDAPHHMKHLCHPAFKQNKLSPSTAQLLVGLSNVLDAFLSTIHLLPASSTKPHVILPPLAVSGGPMFQRAVPYLHVIHLRHIPPAIHTQLTHKYHIPWYKYRQYIDEMPDIKPLWLPLWIWNELHTNMIAAADEDRSDYYHYDEQLADEDMNDYYDYDAYEQLADENLKRGRWGSMFKRFARKAKKWGRKLKHHAKRFARRAKGAFHKVKGHAMKAYNKVGGAQGMMQKYNTVRDVAGVAGVDLPSTDQLAGQAMNTLGVPQHIQGAVIGAVEGQMGAPQEMPPQPVLQYPQQQQQPPPQPPLPQQQMQPQPQQQMQQPQSQIQQPLIQPQIQQPQIQQPKIQQPQIQQIQQPQIQQPQIQQPQIQQPPHMQYPQQKQQTPQMPQPRTAPYPQQPNPQNKPQPNTNAYKPQARIAPYPQQPNAQYVPQPNTNAYKPQPNTNIYKPPAQYVQQPNTRQPNAYMQQAQAQYGPAQYGRRSLANKDDSEYLTYGSEDDEVDDIVSLPESRPAWLPFYFWHWLRHSHAHQFHLHHRQSLMKSVDKDTDVFHAAVESEDVYHYYDDDLSLNDVYVSDNYDYDINSMNEDKDHVGGESEYEFDYLYYHNMENDRHYDYMQWVQTLSVLLLCLLVAGVCLCLCGVCCMRMLYLQNMRDNKYRFNAMNAYVVDLDNCDL